MCASFANQTVLVNELREGANYILEILRKAMK